MHSNIWLFLAEHHANNCIPVSQSEMMYPHLQPLCPFPEPWCELRGSRTHQSSWGTPGDPVGVFRRGHSPACWVQADHGAQELCSTALLSSCHSRRSNHSNGQGSLPGAVFTPCVTGVTPVGMYTHTPREGNRAAAKTKKSSLCQSPTPARKLPSCPTISWERWCCCSSSRATHSSTSAWVLSKGRFTQQQKEMCTLVFSKTRNCSQLRVALHTEGICLCCQMECCTLETSEEPAPLVPRQGSGAWKCSGLSEGLGKIPVTTPSFPRSNWLSLFPSSIFPLAS